MPRVADPASLDELLARAAIENVVHTYSMAMDLKDWDTYSDLFTETIDLQFPETTKGLRGITPSADWVDVVRHTISGFDGAQHIITNVLVEQAGEKASAQAYLQATHALDVDGAMENHQMGAMYTFGLERADERWRIHSIKLVIVWDAGRWELFDIAGARVDAGS